jgi:hypothetical protein
MWGGGLPMLAGVGADDIREVLRGIRTVSLSGNSQGAQNSGNAEDLALTRGHAQIPS